MASLAHRPKTGENCEVPTSKQSGTLLCHFVWILGKLLLCLLPMLSVWFWLFDGLIRAGHSWNIDTPPISHLLQNYQQWLNSHPLTRTVPVSISASCPPLRIALPWTGTWCFFLFWTMNVLPKYASRICTWALKQQAKNTAENSVRLWWRS